MTSKNFIKLHLAKLVTIKLYRFYKSKVPIQITLNTAEMVTNIILIRLWRAWGLVKRFSLEFILSISPQQPHKISQAELNDLVRYLELPKSIAEFLESRLQQWNLLKDDVVITFLYTQPNILTQYFKMVESLVLGNNVSDLTTTLNIVYKLDEWTLFTDSLY